MIILGDLDNFKLVNDVLGYELGDYALRSAAESLKESVRHSDRVYRLGGDEFAIIAPVVSGNELAAFQAITERFYYHLEQLRSRKEDSPENEALRAIDITFAPGLFASDINSIEDIEFTIAETMRLVKGLKEAKGTGMR